MNLNPELVRAGRRLRDRLAELGAEVDRVQADLRTQVGRMGAAGGSPAEIAAAIGLGEQQVREWLPAPPGEPPAVDGTAAAGGVPTAPGVSAAEAYAAAVRVVAEELEDAEDVELGGPSRQSAAMGWTTLSCAFCGDPQDRSRCSFCGKRSRRVGRLVAASGGVHICGECLDLCTEILSEGLGR